MKKQILLLSCLLLTGCSIKKDVSLQDEITKQLEKTSQETIRSTNMNKDYYSYYLPEHIGRLSSTKSGSILNDRDRKFIMNLNVASIVNTNYTGVETPLNTEDLSDPIVSIDGEYNDRDENTHSYHVSVYSIDSQYLLEFTSDTVQFYSISDALSTLDLVDDMYVIARSMKVDTNEVISAYSNADTIDYQSEKIELFEQLVPESGRVEELFEDYSENIDGDEEKNEDGPKQITNVEE